MALPPSSTTIRPKSGRFGYRAAYSGNGDDFPLNITSRYATQWGAWEGIREFIQNWHDGVLSTFELAGGQPDKTVSFEKVCYEEESDPTLVEYRATCSAKDVAREHRIPHEDALVLGRLFYDSSHKSITMVNLNTCLGRCVFLLGHSKKPNREEVIGKFGEGLKLGSLALVRSGHCVAMCTGDEQWRFDIQSKREFEEKVLAVVIKKRRNDPSECEMDDQNFDDLLPPCPVELTTQETFTQIWPIKEEEWSNHSRKFLFLEKPKKAVSTKRGCLILDKELAGNLYVRKVWIKDLKDERMSAAIDLNDIELDRDRQACVDMTQLEQSLSSVWAQAVNKDHSLADDYCRLLHEGKSREVADAKTYITRFADIDMCKAIADAFFRWKGEGFPVSTTTSQSQIRHIKQELNGKKMHLINDTLYTILKKAGRIPQLEKRPKPKEEPYVPPPLVPRTPHEPTEKQKEVIKKARSLVMKFELNFPFDKVAYFNEDYGEVWEQEDVIEVPTWILSSSKVHSRLSNFKCPAKADHYCLCPSVYLASSFLCLRHAHHKDLNDLLFTTISTLALDVHSQSQAEGVHLAEDTGDKKHYHQVMLERREVELQRHMDRLEEERKKEVDKYDKSMTDFQAHLDSIQETVEATKRDMEEKKKEIVSHKEKEMSDMEQRFQQLRGDIRKKIENAVQINSELSEGIREGENKYKEVSTRQEEEQAKHDEQLKEQSGVITRQTQRIAKMITSQREMLQEKDRLKLGENSQLVQGLEKFKQEFDELRMSGKCEVCKDEQHYAVLLPCQHLYLCLECSQQLQTCPTCKEAIKDRKKLYVP